MSEVMQIAEQEIKTQCLGGFNQSVLHSQTDCAVG